MLTLTFLSRITPVRGVCQRFFLPVAGLHGSLDLGAGRAYGPLMRFGTRSFFLVAAVILVAAVPARVGAEGPLVLSPAKWEFGSIPAGTRAFLSLKVANTGSTPITVTVVPTCDCLTTSRSRQVVAAHGEAEFRLTFLAEQDEAGFVRESYIVLTDAEGLDHFYYWAHGFVIGATAPSR